MNEQYLLLWLEGPLQSWGHDSRFGRRDTLPFPTMSGICGIICAALGAGGERRELLAKLTAGHWQVRAFMRRDENHAPLPLCDFQMVGSGYDESDPWQLLHIPKKNDGTRPVGGGTKMTYRYYLQDKAFAVLIALDETLAKQIAAALEAPVWELSLGRKNCVPAEFIGQGVYKSAEAAWRYCEELAVQKMRVCCFNVLSGVHAGQGEVLTLNDVPIQFGKDKRYRDRLVTILMT